MLFLLKYTNDDCRTTEALFDGEKVLFSQTDGGEPEDRYIGRDVTSIGTWYSRFAELFKDGVVQMRYVTIECDDKWFSIDDYMNVKYGDIDGVTRMMEYLHNNPTATEVKFVPYETSMPIGT